MSFFFSLATVFVAPFLMLSAFLGFGSHQMATSSSMHATTMMASTTASSSAQIRVGDWKGSHPMIPVHPATTTAYTTLHVTSLSTTTAAVGTTVQVTGTGFTSSSTISFGSGSVAATTVSADGTELTFIVPSSAGPYCKAGMACPMYRMLVTDGTYSVSVRNNDVLSNSIAFMVIGAQSMITTSVQTVIK